jgi:uridine kinase
MVPDVALLAGFEVFIEELQFIDQGKKILQPISDCAANTKARASKAK